MRVLNNAEIVPLIVAIEQQDSDVVLQLLENYGDIDIRLGNERSSLQCAAQKNCDRVSRILIEHGADIEASGGFGGMTPLHLAVASGALATVRVLLEAGARVNAVSRYGRTALHFALRHVRDTDGPEILDLILRHGAAVNVAGEDGVTPADMAIDYGDQADLEALLERGADPNARIDGLTHLHRLAQGWLPVGHFELLIKWGADIHARDDQGRLAVDIARKRGRNDLIIELLSG